MNTKNPIKRYLGLINGKPVYEDVFVTEGVLKGEKQIKAAQDAVKELKEKYGKSKI